MDARTIESSTGEANRGTVFIFPIAPMATWGGKMTGIPKDPPICNKETNKMHHLVKFMSNIRGMHSSEFHFTLYLQNQC